MVVFQNLSKRYTPGGEFVLRDISLHIKPGQFVFLTGPSGAGKTTFLRLLYGAEVPSQGTLMVGKADLGRLKMRKLPVLRRKLGIIFQDFRLISTRNIYENVAWPLHVAGASSRQAASAARQMLERVGLWDKAHYLAHDLSGGEQQRVAVARALVGKPPLLLADEPTGNLDPDNAREVMRLLLEAHQHGATVLIATHDPLLLGMVQGARMLRLSEGVIDEEES